MSADSHSSRDPRALAMEIWNAALDGVRPASLIAHRASRTPTTWHLDQLTWNHAEVDRVLVVGGGKAGVEMVRGITAWIGDDIPVSGLVNVPGLDEQSIGGVVCRGVRDLAENLPTAAAVESTQEILRMVGQADDRTWVIAAISGGGSATLTAPIPGVSLDELRATIKRLSAAGTDIVRLNDIRGEMDAVKRGGLIAAASGGMWLTLVISDILGGHIDRVASGPTYPAFETPLKVSQHDQVVLGSNAIAIDHAGIRAEALGFNHLMHGDLRSDVTAEQAGRELAQFLIRWHELAPEMPEHDAVIMGGEPIVHLCDASIRGLGGRNTQLVLAGYIATCEAIAARGWDADEFWRHHVLLSGGTDGEDGPTDAAGAMVDAAVHRRIQEMQWDADECLRRNDAYRFFAASGGLIQSGPTGTNVCDIRIALRVGA
ncbi:MAG: DUF4147 domain-containing protein [Planctomycetota bacterium]